MRLLDREILFFGGKGGVGKTTLAAAFALLSADEGRRTLLVSTDPAHSTTDILGTPVGAEPTRIAPQLDALEIDPVREADRYIAGVKERVRDVSPPRLVDEVERQIDIARVSPGAEESALFDRLTRLLDRAAPEYDRILFDTAPTGHTLRLLSLPEQMTLWIDGLIGRRRKMNVLRRMWRNVAGAGAGRDVERRDDPVLAALEERRARFEAARRLLTDADRTAFAFVVVPERLPVAETERAVRTLDRYGIPVGAIFVNRVLPADAEGEFLRRRREREATYLERIERAFSEHPVYRLPLFDADIHGLPALRRLITALPEAERSAAAGADASGSAAR